MRKRRIGSKLGVFVLAAGLLPFGAPRGSGKDKKKRESSDYALVAGTVFREIGLSLPGAEVSIVAAGSPGGFKFKKQQAISDSRGEFAFRVPPVEMKYTVSVKAAGYRPEDKEVAVAGFERVDVFFRLEPSSKLEKGK